MRQPPDCVVQPFPASGVGADVGVLAPNVLQDVQDLRGQGSAPCRLVVDIHVRLAAVAGLMGQVAPSQRGCLRVLADGGDLDGRLAVGAGTVASDQDLYTELAAERRRDDGEGPLSGLHGIHGVLREWGTPPPVGSAPRWGWWASRTEPCPGGLWWLRRRRLHLPRLPSRVRWGLGGVPRRRRRWRPGFRRPKERLDGLGVLDQRLVRFVLLLPTLLLDGRLSVRFRLRDLDRLELAGSGLGVVQVSEQLLQLVRRRTGSGLRGGSASSSSSSAADGASPCWNGPLPGSVPGEFVGVPEEQGQAVPLVQQGSLDGSGLGQSPGPVVDGVYDGLDPGVHKGQAIQLVPDSLKGPQRPAVAGLPCRGNCPLSPGPPAGDLPRDPIGKARRLPDPRVPGMEAAGATSESW